MWSSRGLYPIAEQKAGEASAGLLSIPHCDRNLRSLWIGEVLLIILNLYSRHRAQGYFRLGPKYIGGFKIDLDFFLDSILRKTIKNKQINRLPISLTSVDCPLGASASMVAAKLERIKIIVMIRRDQRNEVCNEIRVVITMDIPLMPATLCMLYLPHFDHEVGWLSLST